MRKEIRYGFQRPSWRDCRMALAWTFCSMAVIAPILFLFLPGRSGQKIVLLLSVFACTFLELLFMRPWRIWD